MKNKHRAKKDRSTLKSAIGAAVLAVIISACGYALYLLGHTVETEVHNHFIDVPVHGHHRPVETVTVPHPGQHHGASSHNVHHHAGHSANPAPTGRHSANPSPTHAPKPKPTKAPKPIVVVSIPPISIPPAHHPKASPTPSPTCLLSTVLTGCVLPLGS